MTPTTNVLNRVCRGMQVWNADGLVIGSVDSVYSIDNARNEDGAHVNIFDALLADALPDGMSERLKYEGYIYLDRPSEWVSGRYILPAQIASIDADGVHLFNDPGRFGQDSGTVM